MRKRTISILLCFSMLIGILAGGGITVSAAKTQPEIVGTSVSNWGAHTYVAGDDTTVVTSNLTANADGSVTISGSQVSAGMGIGVTNTEPVYLDQEGFTLDMSIDRYDTTSNDVWFALFISDKKTVTNSHNEDPVFRGWDNDGSYDYNEGRGFVLIMRPDGEGKLRFQWFLTGVAGNADATPANNELVYCGDGCYDNITLSSGNYDRLKLQLVKRGDGGYDLIVNEGRFTRNGGDRIETNGAINPAMKLTMLDQIFPAGTPAYVKVIASNAVNAETAFSVNSFNGVYANRQNTLESWGVHNYVAGDGSPLNNTITATNTGDLVVSGNQTAGDGELGVTFARPIDVANGISVEFSLDKYAVNGENGADSWIALQIKDNLTVTNSQNPDGVYHKLDIGGGSPDYGSGWHIMMRPQANNVLRIAEIYYCGVDADGNVTKAWNWDANGCYDQIQLDSFEHIKVSLVPGDGGSMNIIFNDGDYIRVGADRMDSDGRINVANGYAFFRKFFNVSRPAYAALSYKSNQGDAEAQFTVHSINGQQAAANTEESWGAHTFVALDGSPVVSDMKTDESGSLVISGSQTAGHGAIGATWKRPIDMKNGISVEFSLDQYSTHGVNGIDSWLAVQLLHQQTITDANNPNGAYRHFEAGNGDYGDGLVMLIRPMENNTLQIAEILINGAQVDGTLVKNNFQGVTNAGCYDRIQVPGFNNIKLDIVPGPGGSFNIIFNDGDYIRVGADRLNNDHGKINVNEGFTWLGSFFNSDKPAYLKLAYKCNAGVGAQFSIHKVNEIAASVYTEEPEIEVTNGVYELLGDTKFENGFVVRPALKSELGSGNGYFNYGDPARTPVWTLAQWDTKYDFRDMENNTIFSELDTGVYSYDSIDKIVTVDTVNGILGMELNASEVYDAPRVAGQAWPHLLIEGSTKNAGAPFASKATNMNRLRLSLAHRLTKFEDHMGDAATGLHGGAFYIYLYVKGINETGAMEMTWFGLTFFDNRIAFTAESGMQDGGKDDASGLFIYQVPARGFATTDYMENGVITPSADGGWTNVDIDLLPYIERCLVLAQERGFMKGVTMDTVIVDGMNMGWEMPGTYDGKMEVKDLSLKSYVGETYELNNGIYNLSVPKMEATETLTVDENLSVEVSKEVVVMDGIEQSMLQMQVINHAGADIEIEGREVTDAYDIGLWINGNVYDAKLDTNLKLAYTAPSGNIKDMQFYSVNASGTAKLLEGTYDETANTFTFELNRTAALAITLEAEEDIIPATGDGISLMIAAALVSAMCVCVILPKKKEN